MGWYNGAMETPRVNPIGLLESTGDWAPPPRRFPLGLRLAAALLLVLFFAVTLLSGAASLGRYCLTTDGADTRALPGTAAPGR